MMPIAKLKVTKIPAPLPGSAWGNDPAFTVAGAAVAVGVSRKAMYDYLTAKRIGYVKLGGQIRIRRSHIDAFIASGTVGAV